MLPDLNVILAQDPGATFFTADLHVHSYGFSCDVSDKTMSISALVDAALERGIAVLSITDHNNDSQVLPSVEYGSKFSDRLLVIPGVEISTANGHLLVYCDPLTPELIGTLLAKIDLQGPKGARDTHTAWSMATVIGMADQLGAIAIAAHVDRDKTGFEKLADGYPNWKKDIILAEGLYGLEFDDSANLKWYSPEDDGSDAAGQRRAIFGERVARSELGITRLAAVQDSDAHTLAEFSADRLCGSRRRRRVDWIADRARLRKGRRHDQEAAHDDDRRWEYAGNCSRHESSSNRRRQCREHGQHRVGRHRQSPGRVEGHGTNDCSGKGGFGPGDRGEG